MLNAPDTKTLKSYWPEYQKKGCIYFAMELSDHVGSLIYTGALNAECDLSETAAKLGQGNKTL